MLAIEEVALLSYLVEPVVLLFETLVYISNNIPIHLTIGCLR